MTIPVTPVKLVDYAFSSDEEQEESSAMDAGMQSESEWSSFGELPSDSSDSFSYRMRSPESERNDDDVGVDDEDDDDDGDEDYTPSRASSSSLESYKSMPTSPAASVSSNSTNEEETTSVQSFQEEEPPRASASSASSSGQPGTAFTFAFRVNGGRVRQDEKTEPSLFHGFSTSSSGSGGTEWARTTSVPGGDCGNSQNAATASTAAFGGSNVSTESWSSLRAAFESNPFKRHNTTTTTERADSSTAASPMETWNGGEVEAKEQPKSSIHVENPFDRVQGRWNASHGPTFSTGFVFNSKSAQEKNTTNAAEPGTFKGRGQHSEPQTTSWNSPTGSSTVNLKKSSENPPLQSTFANGVDSGASQPAFASSTGSTNRFFPIPSDAPKFCFGSKDKPASTTASKPFSARKVPTFSFGTANSATNTGLEETFDAEMRSPTRPSSAPAKRSSVKDEFSFQTEFNTRDAFEFMAEDDGRATSSATFRFSTPDSTVGREKATAESSSASFQFSKTSVGSSATFAPGIAEPPRQRSRIGGGSRRKRNGTSAAQASTWKSDSSARKMPPPAPLFGPSFGSSFFPTTNASRSSVSNETTFGVAMDDADGSSADRFEGNATSNGFSVSEEPNAWTSAKGASFSFGTATTAKSGTTGPTPLRTSAFGSHDNSSAPLNPEVGAKAQFPKQRKQQQGRSSTRRFLGPPLDNLKSTFGEFRIGSSGKGTPKRKSWGRRRSGGIFTNKNSPKRGSAFKNHDPEPSSDGASASPFGLNGGRSVFSYRNPRQRQAFGPSPPADPFVMPIFQSRQPSVSSESTEAGHSRPKLARPAVKKGVHSGFGASTMSQEGGRATDGKTAWSSSFTFPSAATQQQSSGGAFTQKPEGWPTFGGSSRQSGTTVNNQQTNTLPKENPPPAYRGTRRILRPGPVNAAMRSNNTRNDRSDGVSSSEQGEGDAEMESDESGVDWTDLKQQGDHAHSEQKFAEAAELYRESIDALESIMDRDPTMNTRGVLEDKAKLHANRAASLMMLMQIAEAQRECQRSIEANPAYTRAYLRLGRIQLLLGDTSQAQANVETAKGLLANGGATNKKHDAADRSSIRKMEATIEKLSIYQGEIRWCNNVGDFRQALQSIEKALALAPSSRVFQVQKARVLLQQKKFEDIVKFCCEIVQKQRAIFAKATASTEESDLDASETARAKAAEEIAFVGIELGLLWATTLHYQNKIEDAARTLSALETVAPCSAHVIQLKRQWQDMKQLKHSGNECFKRGEFRKALQFYSQALQVDEQHDEYCAIIYCNRAAAHMGLERYHTALLDCGEALQRKPLYPRALLRRARCYMELNKPQEAVLDFDRYLQEQSRTASSDSIVGVRRERNEAKAAVAKAREETRRREAAKKRAEREQRQRHAQDWEKTWEDDKFYENFRRTWGSGSRSKADSGQRQSSGRASFMESRSTPKRTHYDVLGVQKAASSAEIKKAYRKLALVYHPDKSKAAGHGDLFKEMTAAYNVLSDANARAKYDREQLYNRFGNFYEN